MQAYQPRPYPGAISLFKAAIQSDKIESPEDYGWSALTPDFRIIPVSGKHLTLFESENVGNLADALRPALSKESDEA
jgi:thioesterase domain-containing protein